MNMRDMKIIQSYTIKEVQKCEYDQIIEFVMKIRKEIFPMLCQEQLPSDLLHFEQYYVQPENSAFFAAFSEDGTVLGTIGVCPYDGRFDQLQGCYDLPKTAEIVRCYMDPNYRRLGIGTALFKKVTSFSREAGYQTLYLHTHPFLPGAIPFWKAQGFVDRLAEADPVWKTLHMDKKL
ncbi:GNAT family N-acetyltransferase [Bacillus songklensis]|uniref:GNAT family N-acetyltransferase n=2 Tax=Bacillus songklensis TaxID=1069116 RepID=A0ABV8B7N7_9BACI